MPGFCVEQNTLFPIDRNNPEVQYGVIRHVVRMDMQALPLSEAVFLVLLSLAEQPRHGYSILKDVEHMSGGRVVLSTGTLYGALQRLLSRGWSERFETEDTSRDKRAYRLTTKGKRNLQAEHERVRHLARLATVRIANGEA
jgi:DNA-binding PadR family transcriptional regulator